MTRSELYALVKSELETTRPMLSVIMAGVDLYAAECEEEGYGQARTDYDAEIGQK